MSLTNIEKEYNEIEEKKGWQKLFQEIREECEKDVAEEGYSIYESSKNKNRSLNRYRDVNPYDHSRIILHRGNADYINANLVKVEKANRKYILTQGPLKETVGHFWLMVWEQNSIAILMLNKLVEKNHVKCHMYWPENSGSENKLVLDDVELTVEFLKCYKFPNFIKRIFRLHDLQSDEFREISQFHYTTWPDFGLPSSPVAFLQFLKEVRDSGALNSEVGPAVVHCSAGIGRSGTFCLVDCCLVLIDKEGDVSVKSILHELRRHRMGLIQTANQLYFSYKAIIHGINYFKNPSSIDCEEVDIKEQPPPVPPRTHSLIQETIELSSKPLPSLPTNITSNKDENNFNNGDAPLIHTINEDSSLIMEDSNIPNDLLLEENPDQDETLHLDADNTENEHNTKAIDSSNEIKRRKRMERNAALEEKIQAIKKKQKKTSDNSKTRYSKKKVFKVIAIGMLMCIVCIYAHTKFG